MSRFRKFNILYVMPGFTYTDLKMLCYLVFCLSYAIYMIFIIYLTGLVNFCAILCTYFIICNLCRRNSHGRVNMSETVNNSSVFVFFRCRTYFVCRTKSKSCSILFGKNTLIVASSNLGFGNKILCMKNNNSY